MSTSSDDEIHLGSPGTQVAFSYVLFGSAVFALAVGVFSPYARMFLVLVPVFIFLGVRGLLLRFDADRGGVFIRNHFSSCRLPWSDIGRFEVRTLKAGRNTPVSLRLPGSVIEFKDDSGFALTIAATQQVGSPVDTRQEKLISRLMTIQSIAR